ncbi:hypothetical protein [Acinetobacter phage ABPH49]|nr:hypothetical protein [Acinetobacter phage ABPH49]
MCNNCDRISSNHQVIKGSEVVDSGGMLRVSYRCSCGNEDQTSFTDSGNFESECTEYASWEKKEEYDKLKRELQWFESRMRDAEERWEYLWQRDEDSFY